MLYRVLSGVLLGASLMAGTAQAAGLMVINQTVADYAKWRPVFDGDKANQEAAGLTNPHVYQSVGNPSGVTVTFDMADATKAQAFGSSKLLIATMTKAGVKGKPELLYLNQAP